jgi:hypothetical protein
MSATTSRCLGVRPAPLWIVLVIMASEASAPRPDEPFPAGCNPGCIFGSARGVAEPCGFSARALAAVRMQPSTGSARLGP